MSKSYTLKLAHKNYINNYFVATKLESEYSSKDIIQKAIFTAMEKTKEDELPDYGGVSSTNFNFSKDLVAVVDDGVYNIVSGAREFTTLMRFLSNEISCPLKYNGSNDKINTMFKKLEKKLNKTSDDKFKFEELNAATKAAIRKLTININCIKASSKNTIGIEFLRHNPDAALIPTLKAIFGDDNTVCNQYIETAKCLAGTKKPSYYETAPKSVKENYDAVYNGLKKLGNNNTPFKLQMLVLCTDLGSNKYSDINIKKVAEKTFKAHEKMASYSVLFNTLKNMATVTKILDDNLLGYPNLWIGAVKAFGTIENNSNAAKKTKTVGISERWAKQNKENFSNVIRDCIERNKKSIKNSQIVFSTSPIDDGIVFSDRILSTISFTMPYTNTVCMVLKALYKELKEV